jgi:hypothetical protein
VNPKVTPTFNRAVLATAFIILLFACAQPTWAKGPYPHYTFILPDGYVGWVQVIFNDPQASPFQWRDGGVEFDLPESGIVRTSDLRVHGFDHPNKDLFFYRTRRPNGDADLHPMPSEYVPPGDSHGGYGVMDTGGKGRGYSWFIFIGPAELRAKVPDADWDKVVEDYSKTHGGKKRIEFSGQYPTPGRMSTISVGAKP